MIKEMVFIIVRYIRVGFRVVSTTVAFGVFSGCVTAGGISRKNAEGWLSNFVGNKMAHNVCYHEHVDQSLIVPLAGKIYVNADIRYLILTHPNFPKEERVAYIERNGADDHFFENAIQIKAVDSHECRAYLKYLRSSWLVMSECMPLKEILMRMEGESEDFYVEIWREYKLRRERFPVWGFLPVLNESSFVRKAGMEMRAAELLDIVLVNPSLPRGIRKEIARQLVLVDYGGLCKRLSIESSDPRWWRVRYEQANQFINAYYCDENCYRDENTSRNTAVD